MSLSNLVKTTTKSKKRIGRGHGSGKGGHTVGKGKYGQKSKEKIPLMFEGTKIKKSLLKRLPLLRGKGKFKPLKPSPVVVNVKYLNLFKSGEVVNLESLAKKGIIKKEDGKKYGVKILGE
jgi:large subunit ribosomal protein L15